MHERAATLAYALIPLEWILHFADEWAFGFPAWATRHFAPLPLALWLPGMVVGCVALTALGWRAARADGHPAWPFAALAFQSIFAWNACFHLAATVVFREYSPGCASGLVVLLPATAAVLRAARRDARLPRARRRAAIALGFVVHALVVLSLFVDKSG